METIKIESFSDMKTDQRGVSAKIKAAVTNDVYYVNEDPTSLVGKMVEIEVTEKTSQKGNKYKVAKITKVLEQKSSSGNHASNGKVPWLEYQIVAKAAHALALDLEPDGLSEKQVELNSGDLPITIVDRSQARIALVQTVLVAFRDGKLDMPEVEETPFD